MKYETKIIMNLAIIASCLLILLFPVACTVSKPVVNPDGSTNVVHEVDPRLTAGLAIGSAANAASAPVNPSAPWVELGLGAIAVGAGWVAKRKTDKAAADQLLLKTVIQALDTLNDNAVKEAVQKYATQAGVEGKLNTAVKQVGAGVI